MREIKYRGLSKNGWVYGLPFYSYARSGWDIVTSNGWTPTYNNPDEGESNLFTEVDSETIGQYTGLKDKNGKEIYDGDIVSTHREFYFDEDYSVDEDLKGEVVLIASKGACLKKPRYQCNLSGENGIRNQYYNFSAYRSEVIGNIHEHSELIKD